MGDTRRYLGLELAGAKNQKTTLAAIEFYPAEKKIFLLDIYDKIIPDRPQTNDEALLELINEVAPEISRMGVNVPLALPPCITCTIVDCPCPSNSPDPAVQYMKKIHERALASETQELRVNDFTPYTQRPVELWIRYEVMHRLTDSGHFEIDETLGGNKAPLTARMHFLKKRLKHITLVEVWPKLTVAILARELELAKRVVSTYRHLEEGAHAREEIVERLMETHGIFIYDRDLKKVSQSLTAFDAFICAYTALLSENDLCTAMPEGFPAESGWVQFPEIES